MKHWTTQILAAGLSLSLLAGQGAYASEALGHDLHTGSTELSQGVTLTKAHFWSDTFYDLRTEHYLSYTPGDHVFPVVAYGENVVSKSTLTQLASNLEAEGRRVLGGTNGDFYVVSTGEPLGLVVTDGVLRSSSSYLYAMGFRADGTAFIGQPDLKVEATLPSGRVAVTGGLNKVRQVRSGSGGGLTLMNRDFGPTTQNDSPGIDVILRSVTAHVGEPVPEEELWHEPVPLPPAPAETPIPSELPAPDATPAPEDTSLPSETPAPEEDKNVVLPPIATYGMEDEKSLEPVPLTYSDVPRIGGRMVCQVEQVVETQKGDRATRISDDMLVLTMNGLDDPAVLARLKALQPGDEIDIDIYSREEGWGDAMEATGALYRLLEDGAIVDGLEKTQAPRTAAGIRPDGTVIFYTIDGRQPGYSVGASYVQVAQRLLELGCVDAVGLDGGGSTTLGAVYPDEGHLSVMNRPSGGKERANSTAILLTTDLKPTGDPQSLMLTPGDALILSGSAQPLTATTVDTGWYAVGPTTNVTYSVSGPGSVDSDGVFTAGSTAGTALVTAAQPGGVRGTAAFTVVSTPDRIKLMNQSTGASVSALALNPNQQIDLTAAAKWRNLDLVSQDTSYLWTCDPAVGTITPEGLFTAAAQTAEGKLTVTAGEKSVDIPVSVAGHTLPLADMEGELTAFISTDTVRATPETSLTHVRTGRQSLRLNYDSSADGAAQLDTTLPIPEGELYLGLWLYGDNSGNNLAAVFTDKDGQELLTSVAGLTFNGWEHRQVPIPNGSTALKGFRLIYGGGETTDGTLWLDQLTTSTEREADFTPPTITLDQKGNRITATVGDNMDRGFSAQAVTLTLDGVTMAGKWSEEKSTLTFDLPPLPEPPVPAEPAEPEQSPVPTPQPTGIRRVTVTAVDVSGNLGRASLNIGTPSAAAFADLEGHWAAPYVTYLYDQKVTNGVQQGNELYFLPDNNITRAEFFTMVARWLRLDLSQYATVALPFVDLSLIPDWALAPIQAMYALGYVGGSQGADGLCVNPNLAISRTEAMTILGRIQPKGWPEAELSSFPDGDQVPDWAAPYVRSLVGQKVVGGYDDGSLRPSDTLTRAQVAKMLTILR